MSTNKVNTTSSEGQAPSVERGALAFIYNEVKAFGEALVVLLACSTLVGIPFVKYWYNRKVEPQNPVSPPVSSTISEEVSTPSTPRLMSEVPSPFRSDSPAFSNRGEGEKRASTPSTPRLVSEVPSPLRSDSPAFSNRGEGEKRASTPSTPRLVSEVPSPFRSDSPAFSNRGEGEKRASAPSTPRSVSAPSTPRSDSPAFSNRGEREESVPVGCPLSPPVQPKTVNEELEEVLDSHVQEARELTKGGKEIHWLKQKEMNAELSRKVTDILKEAGIKGHFIGVNHDLFQKIIHQRLILSLDEVIKSVVDPQTDPKVREILFAYGYEEDDFDTVLRRYHESPQIPPTVSTWIPGESFR